MILSLDLATTTGWCAGVPGGSPTYGHHRFAPEGSGEGRISLNALIWLDQTIGELKPGFVYAEAQYLPVAGRGGKGARPEVVQRLYALRGFTAAMCEKHGARLVWVPAVTITKFFTAFGKWPKGEKKAATIRVCQMYGFSPAQNDEADALAIWLYGEHAISPTLASGRSMGTLYAKAAR